ncbi:hypothetical protein K440DRAFT_156910 [Wilcoxina mikolae CBS 423.85]|nr:hypothetical protein K440DRAFT_156910 [Wilcoxina mikolae CBS 423.85]
MHGFSEKNWISDLNYLHCCRSTPKTPSKNNKTKEVRRKQIIRKTSQMGKKTNSTSCKKTKKIPRKKKRPIQKQYKYIELGRLSKKIAIPKLFPRIMFFFLLVISDRLAHRYNPHLLFLRFKPRISYPLPSGGEECLHRCFEFDGPHRENIWYVQLIIINFSIKQASRVRLCRKSNGCRGDWGKRLI